MKYLLKRPQRWQYLNIFFNDIRKAIFVEYKDKAYITSSLKVARYLCKRSRKNSEYPGDFLTIESI